MKPSESKAKTKGAPAEYWIYFALLFAVELPVSILRFFARLANPAPRKDWVRSPISDAKDRASASAHQIFAV